MTSNEQFTSGLGEVRLRPEEVDESPFQIFAQPKGDNIITGCREVEFPPFNSLTPESTHIVFQCPPFSKEYIKLDSVKTYGTGRILEIQENGSLKAPAASVDLSCVNNFASSIWNKVSGIEE